MISTSIHYGVVRGKKKKKIIFKSFSLLASFTQMLNTVHQRKKNDKLLKRVPTAHLE